MTKVKDLNPEQLREFYRELLENADLKKSIQNIQEFNRLNSQSAKSQDDLSREMALKIALTDNIKDNQALRQFMACVDCIDLKDDTGGGMKLFDDIFKEFRGKLNADTEFPNLKTVEAPAKYAIGLDQQRALEALALEATIRASIDSRNREDAERLEKALALSQSLDFQNSSNQDFEMAMAIKISQLNDGITSGVLARFEQVVNVPQKLINLRQDKISFDQDECGIQITETGLDKTISVAFNGKNYNGIFIENNEIQFSDPNHQAIDHATKKNLNNHILKILDYHDNKIEIKNHLESKSLSSEDLDLVVGKFKVELESGNKLKFSRTDNPSKPLSLDEKCVVAKEMAKIMKGVALTGARAGRVAGGGVDRPL